MSNTRDKMIEKTCELLEAQGYHATGLNQILEESRTPKGSLYYYFPGGKEALAAEAITSMGQEVQERIETTLAATEAPGAAVRQFILRVAHHVQASEFRAGGPITTVALEAATTSERLNTACEEVYQAWQATFEAKFEESGLTPADAERLATLVIASLEGAIILSRTRRSTAPLEHAAASMARLISTYRLEE